MKRTLILLGSSLTSVASGFIILMHFRHEPHWPQDRFGGTLGALALIPICLLSYIVSCYCFNQWLHPLVFPRMRAIIPRPAQEPPPNPRKWALTSLGSFLSGTVSGAIVIVHFFHQPQWPQHTFGGTPGAVACIPICIFSYSLCFHCAHQWLRPILSSHLLANPPGRPRTR